MISKYVGVFALLSIISVANGFTVGRHGRINSVGEQIMTALEAKSEMKELQDRVDQRLAPLFAKVDNLGDLMQLMVDYSRYMTLIGELAETAGTEINANHSEEEVLAAFEKSLEKAQSEPFYERIEKAMGKSNVEDLLNLLKITVKEFVGPSK